MRSMAEIRLCPANLLNHSRAERCGCSRQHLLRARRRLLRSRCLALNYGLVPAQPDAQCDGDELGICSTGEDVVEPAFEEEPDTAGLDVETGAGIEPELGFTAGENVIGIVRTGDLGVVDPTATNDIGTEGALLRRLELEDEVAGTHEEAILETGEAGGGRIIEIELLIRAVDLDPHRPTAWHERDCSQAVPAHLGRVIEIAERNSDTAA